VWIFTNDDTPTVPDQEEIFRVQKQLQVTCFYFLIVIYVLYKVGSICHIFFLLEPCRVKAYIESFLHGSPCYEEILSF
jgi:hypothetical protein